MPVLNAEWEFGGFPAWLLNKDIAGDSPIKLRSSDPRFLKHVDAYFGQLLPRLAAQLYSKGGPIVMVQIENEYGYNGDDKVYLRHLAALARQHLGNEVSRVDCLCLPLALSEIVRVCALVVVARLSVSRCLLTL